MWNLVEIVIMGILLALSIWAFYIFFERIIAYRRIQIDRFKSRHLLEKELIQGLHHLASIASTAPYIGLLGTVLGIIHTFYVMGKTGLADTLQIMVGLSLALKATAVGLLVAIPATLLYNHLVKKVREILLEWEARNGN